MSFISFLSLDKICESIQLRNMHQILQKNKVSDFCPTRWVEKVTGLDDFEDLFAPIVFCLEEMSLS